jgi:hypothetical protein
MPTPPQTPPGQGGTPPGQDKKPMGITTHASNGVQVNSAAKDSALTASTLGAQTTAAIDEVIVPDAITANNEGNLMVSPVYIGRLICIRWATDGVATVAINAAGSGYVVNEVITDNGAGATAARRARFIVTSVSGGAVTGLKMHEAGDSGSPAVTVGADRGEYSVNGTLTGRATTASASGTGLTVDVTMAAAMEVRYINADASNTLTVSDAWIDGPASGENWRVAYIIQDAATVNGLALINKRTDDYSSTRRFVVTKGVSTNNGWFFMTGGVSLETSGEATGVGPADIVIDGRFDVGYVTGHGQKDPDGSIGSTVSGASIFFSASASSGSNNLVMDINADSDFNVGVGHFFDFFGKGVHNYRFDTAGRGSAVDCKFLKIAQDLDIASNISGEFWFYKNVRVEGSNFGTTANIVIDSETQWVGPALIMRMGGFTQFASAFTHEIRNTEFTNDNDRMITINDHADAIWNVVNPIWTPDRATQGDLEFFGSTDGTLNELFELNLTVTDTAGTAISGATAKIIEKTLNNDIPHDGVTAADGTFDVDVLKEVLTPNGVSAITRATRDNFALHVNNYGDSPFVTTLPVAAGVAPANRFGQDTRFVSLPPDTAISEASQATAITGGSGILVEHQLTLPYDAQTGNFTVGQVVTGTTSGATGTILSDADGGASGTLILQGVTGFFQDNEAITDPVTGAAVVNSATGGTDLSHKVFAYDAGTGSVPTIGETITVANAGTDTTGEVLAFEGNATTGILILENWNGVQPDNNVLATGGTSTFSATSDTTGGGSSVSEEFYWAIDINNKTLQAAHDYLAARMAEDTLALNFEDVHLWGADELAAILFLSATGFFTQRNVAAALGVWIHNRAGGTVAFFTSDDGTQVVPPVTISVTFDQMRDDTEVWVFPTGVTGEGNEIAHIENVIAGSFDNRSFTWSAPAGTGVDYTILNFDNDGPDYEYIRVVNFTVPASNTTIIINQQLDRNSV